MKSADGLINSKLFEQRTNRQLHTLLGEFNGLIQELASCSSEKCTNFGEVHVWVPAGADLKQGFEGQGFIWEVTLGKQTRARENEMGEGKAASRRCIKQVTMANQPELNPTAASVSTCWAPEFSHTDGTPGSWGVYTAAPISHR